MPKQTFTLWNEQVITAANALEPVTSDGTFKLAVSAPVSNSQGALRSLRLVLRYDSITPDAPELPEDPSQTFDISAIVEGRGEDGTQWFPVAYQFSPFKATYQGRERIIILQPNILVLDLGVDDIIFVNDATRARVSRQQGAVPDTEMRVALSVTERGFGQGGAFQSVKISGFGELFDA